LLGRERQIVIGRYLGWTLCGKRRIQAEDRKQKYGTAAKALMHRVKHGVSLSSATSLRKLFLRRDCRIHRQLMDDLKSLRENLKGSRESGGSFLLQRCGKGWTLICALGLALNNPGLKPVLSE
jgi:hypothetical protein